MLKMLKGLMTSLALLGGLTTNVASAQQTDHTIRIGLVVPPTHQWTVSAKEFGEELKVATDGRLSVALFPSSQLGSEAQMIQQIQSGALDMGWLTTAELSNRVPALAALHAPFLVKDISQARMVLESPIAIKMLERFPEQLGAVGLGYGMTGLRQILTRDEASGPGDIAGKKIRVIPSAPARDFYELMDAAPTPIPFAAVYDAFANGQVDGIDMDFEATFYNKYYQLAQTMLVTNHVMAPMAVIYSEKLWTELPAGDQELIRTLLGKHLKLVRDRLVANEASFRARLADEGFPMKDIPREPFADIVAAWDAKWESRAPDIKKLRELTAK
ncbi:TRAP transporter substrate-binding protein [Ensifer sp. ENS04]|uniref:TRAP transporter substrate-binding protein n=1 Tax=Ensifer sp. ENS04 TaxID=2769281 RepID=UPI00177F09FB|nr:TRAP transporter substrate-binding protein [Ensifer sp. ENS04]MBD9541452.1 TRAP transporter substrate-binding protein [Ensifer sp. ENS04]